MLDYATLRLFWKDREGNEAKSYFYVSSSLAWEPIFSAAVSGFMPRIQSLTDAYCARLDVTWAYRHYPRPLAADGSSVQRKALLLFENQDERLDAISLVSVRPDIFEHTGPYAGIRVDPAAISAFLDMLATLPLVMKTGEPFGPTFVAGSLAY